ncbi:hypothetical protein MASR2M64_12190 [Candidatus Cloacimonadota bacterium]
MKTMKLVFFVLMFICVLNPLLSKHSDRYLLGNFSYIRAQAGMTGRLEALSSKMKEAGYNATVCEVTNSSTQPQISELLRVLDVNYIDAILTDLAWEEGDSQPVYGTEALSMGNYWRFEAEYDSSSAFNQNVDKYFSINSKTTGVAIPENIASGNYILKLNNNQRGYGLNKLEFRWANTSGRRYNIGPEFRFVQRSYANASNSNDDNFDANPCNDDTLYVTIAFKCTGIPTNPSTVLMQLSCNGYPDNDPNTPANGVAHHNQTTGQTGLSSILNVGSYNSMPLITMVNNPSVWEHKELTLQIAVRDLYNAGLIDTTLGWRYSLKNLNPQLYWNGLGSIEIDYVEFEDTMHKKLKHNTAFRDSVRSRVQYLANLRNNIKYLYLSDEPTQGQFEQYKEIDQHIFDASHPMPASISGVITCTWLNNRNVVKPDGNIYSHVSLFSDISSPQAIMFDIYPLSESIKWNSATITNGIQKVLDDNMLRYYKEYKGKCQLSNSKFIPIPQSYGTWNVVTNKWTYLRPPKYMQKSLQLLPLCYGADGIVNFKLYDYVPNVINNIQAYSSLNWYHQTQTLTENNNWQGIIEANGKVLCYSKYMKPNEWLDAGTIQTSGYSGSTSLSSVLIDSLYVQPQYLLQNGIDLMMAMCSVASLNAVILIRTLC